MKEFKSREEYEAWKKERMQGVKEGNIEQRPDASFFKWSLLATTLGAFLLALFLAPVIAVVIVLVAVLYFVASGQKSRLDKMTPQERMQCENSIAWGNLTPNFICPHCQIKGQVYTKSVNQKKGVSGAKATGALLTGGLSLLVTGLSRKEQLTQAHCCNCNTTWHF